MSKDWSVLDGAPSAAVSVASLVESSETPWVVRPFDGSSDDSDAMHYLLGIGYTRSRAGWRAKAHRAGGRLTREQRQNGNVPSEVDVERQRVFLDSMRPLWTWLLDNAVTMLAVDRGQPHIILGWLVMHEPNVIHAVGAKRSFCERQDGDDSVAAEIVRTLLGDRLRKHQICTLELPQLSTRGSIAIHDNEIIGIDRPREWSLDPTWLGLHGAWR